MKIWVHIEKFNEVNILEVCESPNLITLLLVCSVKYQLFNSPSVTAMLSFGRLRHSFSCSRSKLHVSFSSFDVAGLFFWNYALCMRCCVDVTSTHCLLSTKSSLG